MRVLDDLMSEHGIYCQLNIVHLADEYAHYNWSDNTIYFNVADISEPWAAYIIRHEYRHCMQHAYGAGRVGSKRYNTKEYCYLMERDANRFADSYGFDYWWIDIVKQDILSYSLTLPSWSTGIVLARNVLRKLNNVETGRNCCVAGEQRCTARRS